MGSGMNLILIVIFAHPPPHDPHFRVEAWGVEG